MLAARIAIFAASGLENPAKALAASLHLPLVTEDQAGNYDFLLQLMHEHLALKNMHEKKTKPFYIDFLSGKLWHRSKQAGLKRELLARALGVKPNQQPKILDATAGLGRDSFILATLGFEITMLERSPILWALLNDALTRASNDPAMHPTIQRMRLIQNDAINYLPSIPETHRPDVIYLDPMFPERQKSASVKKEMVLLQELLGKSHDDEELFKVCLSCAAKRVVVKRPRLATYLTERSPHFSLSGKTSRFDIYLV